MQSLVVEQYKWSKENTDTMFKKKKKGLLQLDYFEEKNFRSDTVDT